MNPPSDKLFRWILGLCHNYLLVVSIDWCAVLVEWLEVLTKGYFSPPHTPPPPSPSLSLSPATHTIPHNPMFSPHSSRGVLRSLSPPHIYPHIHP